MTGHDERGKNVEWGQNVEPADSGDIERHRVQGNTKTVPVQGNTGQYRAVVRSSAQYLQVSNYRALGMCRVCFLHSC